MTLPSNSCQSGRTDFPASFVLLSRSEASSYFSPSLTSYVYCLLQESKTWLEQFDTWKWPQMNRLPVTMEQKQSEASLKTGSSQKIVSMKI